LFGCFLAAIVLFDRGTIFNAFFPSLTILGTVLGVNIFNVGTERSQRDEMRKTFGRYVSPTVAAKILNSMEEGQLLLDGQEQVVTTMFADVRGYTHLSRIIEPSKLITLLNVYLSAIIDPVIKHEGIVNKFAGDNIMAVWNAPETCYEHPLMAVKAALDAQRAIAAVWERQPGMPRMEFGIGIDTGVAVVGNMGSEDRLEYSVIGETVNFASRITSVAPANKIWIGASTYEKEKGYVEASEVENVVVKGGSLPFVVYEITALKSNGCLHENGGGS
jgi:adenylate cyclase